MLSTRPLSWSNPSGLAPEKEKKRPYYSKFPLPPGEGRVRVNSLSFGEGRGEVKGYEIHTC
jgi:hypothetical protein